MYQVILGGIAVAVMVLAPILAVVLYDLLVGSTTHGVLLRAPCPVVIVPPKDRKSEKTKR